MDPAMLLRIAILISVIPIGIALGACASRYEHMPPQELLKANIEAMQAAVPAKVSDLVRAARVGQAIDALRQQLVSFDAIQATFQSNIRVLNARPDATRSEFETLVERFDKQRIAVRSRLFVRRGISSICVSSYAVSCQKHNGVCSSRRLPLRVHICSSRSLVQQSGTPTNRFLVASSSSDHS
jgi:hypothetical protein